MLDGISSNGYSRFAQDVYLSLVYPHLTKVLRLQQIPYSEALLYYVKPRENSKLDFGFHPSSFALLVGLACDPHVEVDEDALNVTAAIELFYASCLAIDDLVDNHNERCQNAALRSIQNDNIALLVGNMQIIISVSLILRALERYSPSLMEEVINAYSYAYLGELQDEPSSWVNVAKGEELNYWRQMSVNKLSIGHLAARVGTFLGNRTDLIEDFHSLEVNMSIISQLLNDLGDICGYCGFLQIESDTRPIGEETQIKPMHHTIWLSQAGVESPEKLLHSEIRQLLIDKGYIDFLNSEINELREAARAELCQMPIKRSEYFTLLEDFIASPQLPDNINQIMLNPQ